MLRGLPFCTELLLTVALVLRLDGRAPIDEAVVSLRVHEMKYYSRESQEK